jgi:hypothetical protein
MAKEFATRWSKLDTATAVEAGVTSIEEAFLGPRRRDIALARLQKFHKKRGDELSRLVGRNAKRDTRTFTERRRGDKKQLDTGHLVRAVSERVRRGGQYASVVQKSVITAADGSVQERRDVVSDKDGVAQLLVGRFREWMRKPDAWYHDADINKPNRRGRRLRRQLAELGDEFDMTGTGMPPRFRYMLKYLKRVDGAKPELYAHTLDEITKEEWHGYFSKVKKNTAPGRSGLTANMVAALSPRLRNVLRRIINIGLRSRRVGFTSWLQRVLCPIPKERGNPDLEKSRPLCLLEVLAKAYWAIISTRVSKVWEDNCLLQKQQFGFRKGKSVLDPLLLATLTAEQQYCENSPLYMLLQDISKAYDSVARYIGKEMSLRRLGMPDDLIDTYLQMDVGNRCAVVTAYGYSDEILGTEEGSFEFERGWCQGASESPDGWVAFYDILIAMQNDGERVNAANRCLARRMQTMRPGWRRDPAGWSYA